MRLIIIRHGETEENVKKLIQGRIPGKLTKKGISQSKKLAKRLKNEKIDAIFSSDLKRAEDTVKEIAKFQKAPVFYISELREKNFGVFEGCPREEYYSAVEKSNLSFGKFKPENGESLEEVKKRIERFLQELFKKYKGKTVLLCTHGGVIKSVFAIFLKKKIDEVIDIDIDNTGVNIFEFSDDGKHEVIMINSIEHL